MRLHIKAYRDSLGAYERETGHKKTTQPTGFYSLDKVGSMPPSAGTNPQRRITAAGDRPMRRPESGMARCIRFRTKKTDSVRRARGSDFSRETTAGKRPGRREAPCGPTNVALPQPALLAQINDRSDHGGQRSGRRHHAYRVRQSVAFRLLLHRNDDLAPGLHRRIPFPEKSSARRGHFPVHVHDKRTTTGPLLETAGLSHIVFQFFPSYATEF